MRSWWKGVGGEELVTGADREEKNAPGRLMEGMES
jgi:hypothetical protein